jgi:hypothetical protein
MLAKGGFYQGLAFLSGLPNFFDLAGRKIFRGVGNTAPPVNMFNFISRRRRVLLCMKPGPRNIPFVFDVANIKKEKKNSIHNNFFFHGSAQRKLLA